jgi:hypothetical protein
MRCSREPWPTRERDLRRLPSGAAARIAHRRSPREADPGHVRSSPAGSVDLRKRRRYIRNMRRETEAIAPIFRTDTQARPLLRPQETCTLASLARGLSLSRSTLHRDVQGLEDAELVRVTQVGRSRILHRTQPTPGKTSDRDTRLHIWPAHGHHRRVLPDPRDNEVWPYSAPRPLAMPGQADTSPRALYTEINSKTAQPTPK